MLIDTPTASARPTPSKLFHPGTSAGYRPDIDGLRSIAVLLVILFHYDLADALHAGFIGVDVFFVISGFLIVPTVLRQIDDGSFRFRMFYARRIRRLASPLVVTTALTLAAGLLVLTPQELEALAKETIAAQLYASNIYYWRFLNYFGLQADGAFLLHTWSLAVEEQFYLVFPPLLLVIARLLPRHITAVLAAIFLGSFALNLAMVEGKPEATFYLLPTRIWEFTVGALTPQVATFAARWRVPSSWTAAAGLGLLGVALFLHRSTTPFPGAFAALPVAATMALLVAGADEDGLWGRLIGSPVPVFIGRISYELYLVHWPVRVFAPLLVLDYTLGARIGALALCFVLAVPIYRFADVPVRSRRILTRNRRLVLTYVGATTVLLAVSAATLGSNGLPERLTGEQLALAARADDADGAFRHCENRFEHPCVLGDTAVRPSWIVYGDSHADALASSFADVLRTRGEAGWFVFQSGCLPVLDSGNRHCRDFNRRIGMLIARNPDIRDVAIVSTWRQPIERGFTDRAGREVRDDGALDAFRLNLRRTIAERAAGGRRLVVWLPVPGAKRSVPNTLARNAMLKRAWNIAYTKAEHENRFTFLTGELARHPEVVRIDPARRICEGGLCRVSIDEHPLYHDDAHPAGSQRPFFSRIAREDLARLPLRASPGKQLDQPASPVSPAP